MPSKTTLAMLIISIFAQGETSLYFGLAPKSYSSFQSNSIDQRSQRRSQNYLQSQPSPPLPSKSQPVSIFSILPEGIQDPLCTRPNRLQRYRASNWGSATTTNKNEKNGNIRESAQIFTNKGVSTNSRQQGKTTQTSQSIQASTSGNTSLDHQKKQQTTHILPSNINSKAPSNSLSKPDQKIEVKNQQQFEPSISISNNVQQSVDSKRPRKSRTSASASTSTSSSTSSSANSFSSGNKNVQKDKINQNNQNSNSNSYVNDNQNVNENTATISHGSNYQTKKSLSVDNAKHTGKATNNLGNNQAQDSISVGASQQETDSQVNLQLSIPQGSNLVSGNDNALSGKNNLIQGDKNTLIGLSNAISGNGNKILGVENASIGNNNAIAGTHNAIVGNNNMAIGNANAVTGSTNTIQGNSNGIWSSKNIVKGNGNVIKL